MKQPKRFCTSTANPTETCVFLRARIRVYLRVYVCIIVHVRRSFCGALVLFYAVVVFVPPEEWAQRLVVGRP